MTTARSATARAFLKSRYASYGLADGAGGAPVGRPQYPSLLTGYGPLRPPWNVAGVDYRCGVPEDKLARLTDWRTLSNQSALNIDPVAGTLTFNSDFVFDGVDFSRGMGCYLRNQSGTASNITFKNCFFALPANNTQSVSNAFNSFTDQNSATVSFTNCTFDGVNMPNMGPFLDVKGNTTLKYNWFKNSGSQILSMSSTLASLTVTYQYNLVDNFAVTPGSHRNCIQWIMNGPTTATFTFTFNTTYQYTRPLDPNTAVGEMVQIAANTNSVTYASPLVQNNTLIAKPVPSSNTVSQTASVSALFHGNSGGGYAGTVTSGSNKNNYIDQSGALIAYYAASMTPTQGWTSSGNVDMNTGAIITP